MADISVRTSVADINNEILWGIGYACRLDVFLAAVNVYLWAQGDQLPFEELLAEVRAEAGAADGGFWIIGGGPYPGLIAVVSRAKSGPWPLRSRKRETCWEARRWGTFLATQDNQAALLRVERYLHLVDAEDRDWEWCETMRKRIVALREVMRGAVANTMRTLVS